MQKLHQQGVQIKQIVKTFETKTKIRKYNANTHNKYKTNSVI
jgi:ribosomal protein L11